MNNLGLSGESYIKFVQLRLSEGSKQHEIADELGVTDSAITNLLNRSHAENKYVLVRRKIFQLRSEGKSCDEIAEIVRYSKKRVQQIVWADKSEKMKIFGRTYRRFGATHIWCSADGEFITFSTKPFEIKKLKPYLNKSLGYMMIDNLTVARVVGSCWIREPNPEECIYHDNADLLDNRLCNLRIGTVESKIGSQIKRGAHVTIINPESFAKKKRSVPAPVFVENLDIDLATVEAIYGKFISSEEAKELGLPT